MFSRKIATEDCHYDHDFYAWTLQTISLLKEQRFVEIDVENLIEEVDGMAKSYRRELISRFTVLMAHLLKWKFQPVRRGKSWSMTIQTQRFDIQDLLKESPSLKNQIPSYMVHAYKKAKMIAIKQTSLEEVHFPKYCPFSMEQCLDDQFFPE